LENFLLLLGFETILFLIYQLNIKLQSGWFLQPTPYEMAILIGLASLAGFFGWQVYRGYKKPQFSQVFGNFVKSISQNTVWLLFLCLAVIGLSLTILIPPNYRVPSLVQLLLKNKDAAGFLSIIGMEILGYSISLRFLWLNTLLRTLGGFIFRHALWILFVLLVVVKIILLAPITRGLIMLNDSYDYWVMANQIFHGVLNVSLNHRYPPLNSAVLSSIFLFGVRNSLQHAEILNSIISSTAIFPLYLIARQFLDKKISLFFVLTCAVYPFHIVYPGLLYSENLYYPLFFWAVFFSFSCPGNRRLIWLWDILYAVTLSALWLTRYMTMPLIPVFLFIWWMKPEQENSQIQFKPSKHKLKRLLIISAIVLSLFGIWPAAGLAAGVDLGSMLGFSSSDAGNPENLTLSRLFFWMGISAAYLCLILAPVLDLLILRILSWKQIIWNGVLVRWISAVVALTSMLMIVVTLYAWQASFNFPSPSKFTGRYILYIAALVWLTIIILLKEKLVTSRIRVITVGLISAVAIFASYQVFFNLNWILKRSIFYYRFVDIFTISLLQWIFLGVIAVMIIGTSILIFRGGVREATLILIGSILCINLVVWPAYLQKIKEYENPARQLDEILSGLLQDNINEANKATIFGPRSYKFFSEELEVHGFDPLDFTIKKMFKGALHPYNCTTNLMVKYSDGQRLAIVDRSYDCDLPEKAIRSIYTYNGKQYAVIKLPVK
jgi:hypothetical protein